MIRVRFSVKAFFAFFPSLIDAPCLIGASHDNCSKILGNSKKDKNHLSCSVACFINKGFSISSYMFDVTRGYWQKMLLLGDLPLYGLDFPYFRRKHISSVELVTVMRINTYYASHWLNVQYWTPKLNYYSFNLFLRFWLAKITRITHHNQLLLTKFAKFGRIMYATMNRWRQKCSKDERLMNH